MNEFHALMRDVLGVPARPDPTACPTCGSKCWFVASTRFTRGEPCYYAYCRKCNGRSAPQDRVRICPAGHLMTKKKIYPGYHSQGATKVWVCESTTECVEFRTYLRALLDMVWEDPKDPEIAVHFDAIAAQLQGLDPGHWMVSLSEQLPRIRDFREMAGSELVKGR